MLHVLPFVNYLNHGFFSFNPILFHDLAAANGYDIVRLSIASNHGIEIGGSDSAALSRAELQERCSVDGSAKGSLSHLLHLGRSGKRTRRPLSMALRRVMKDGPNVSVVAVLRRQTDASFQFPIQGMYSGANISDSQSARNLFERRRFRMIDLLARARSMTLETDPFPHLLIDDALDAESYAMLASQFPSVDVVNRRGRRVKNNHLYLLSAADVATHPAISAAWKAFFRYPVSVDFWRDVLPLIKSQLLTINPGLESLAGRPLEDFRVGERAQGRGLQAARSRSIASSASIRR